MTHRHAVGEPREETGHCRGAVAISSTTAEMVLAPRASTVSLLEPVMIMAYFFDTIASTVSATLRADSCVSAVA